jgi:hypothetical protein
VPKTHQGAISTSKKIFSFIPVKLISGGNHAGTQIFSRPMGQMGEEKLLVVQLYKFLVHVPMK